MNRVPRVKTCRLVGTLLALFLFSHAFGTEIVGRVELPKPHGAPVKTQNYEVVAASGTIAAPKPLAVVYLEGEFPAAAPAATVQLVQKGLTFIPALLAIQVGTKVEFPNFDDLYHNVFSFSPPKRFDLGRYRTEDRPVPSQVFDKPGLVTLRCEIHSHMRGQILVLNTPHFVVTDENGRFRLAGLPAGKFIVKAWIDSTTTHERSVELLPGATLRVDFP